MDIVALIICAMALYTCFRRVTKSSDFVYLEVNKVYKLQVRDIECGAYMPAALMVGCLSSVKGNDFELTMKFRSIRR